MTLGCFILEDSPGQSAVWEYFAKQAGFEMNVTATNRDEAIEKIAQNTGVLVAYILDMSTPLTRNSKNPHPYAGPDLREHLIQSGVPASSILLISNVISEYDLKSCSDHQIDPSMIMEKHELSVEKIQKTFASVLQKQ